MCFMEEIVEGEEDVEDKEDVEEDVNIHELEHTDASNEVVKIFNQNVLYALNGIFKQCGYQSICEECYQNKGDFDILRCAICRT